MITTHKNNLIARCKERLYTLDDVMGCVTKQDGDMWTIDIEHKDYPSKMKDGVGTELKRLLSFVGIKASPNCKCTARAITMNAKGVQWCKDNKEEIIDWLEEEAKRRNLPFVRLAGAKMLSLAISRAESKLRTTVK